MDKERRMDDTKMLWHMDRVMAWLDRGERVPPVHIDAGLTKKCNERCIYCYGYFQNMTGEVMSRDALVENLVRSGARIGLRSLAFIGDGDPTLNPALYEALQVGKKEGLSLSISTSGILLNTDERIATVLESCEWMRFNISAFTVEGYAAIHRVSEKARNTVLDNIRRMVEYKHKHGLTCDIGLQTVFVPTGDMPKELEALSKFAVEVGVDYHVIKQCSLPDAGESGMVQFAMSDYDRPEIVDLLKRVEALSTKQTVIIPKWTLIQQKGEKPYENCSSIPFISEVSGNGDWYPCGYMFGGKPQWKDFRFGNLHEQSLEEMWSSDRYWNIVRYMDKEFDVHTMCHGCCRQDKCNEFAYTYKNKPKGVNFI